MEQAWSLLNSCASSPALSDLALITAIDGEADADILNHLCSCPHCATRARALARLQQKLRAQLYRLFCPPSDQLIEYKQGFLTFDQRSIIARHLTICPHCAHEVALIEYAVEHSW